MDQKIIQPVIEDMNKRNFLSALSKLEKIIIDYPGLPFEFLLKGDIFIKMSDLNKAKSTYEEGIKKDKIPERCLLGLGIISEKLKNYEKAVSYYKESLKINKTAEVYNQLGLLQKEGLGLKQDTMLALEHFDKGLAVNPKYFQCAFNKGNILLNKQNYSGALKTFLKPFMINEDEFILGPENKHYEKFIPKISQSIEAIAHSENTLSQIHRKIIEQILTINELNNSATKRISLRSISTAVTISINDKIRELTSSGITNNTLLEFQKDRGNNENLINLDKANPEEILNNEAIINFINSPLVLKGLKFRNILLDAETILTSIRRLMLKQYENDTNNFNHKKFQSFLKTISYQCFENEYIWFVTSEEEEILKKLNINILKKYKNNEVVYDSEIFLLSSYKKLADIPELKNFLLNNSQNIDVENLIKMQLKDFLEEDKLKKNIKSIKKIKDKISLKVQLQYESNPYPRWTKENIEAYSTNTEIIESNYLTRISNDIFPNILKNFKKINKILIAGCGTGRQAIAAAVADPKSDVHAVDISKSSISYGIRQANELNIKNIKWFHGDILDLDSFDESYDVIESSGVLHHMDNPVDGFEILSNKLEINGYFKLGLYAKSFRDLLLPAQKIIKDNKINSNFDGVKKAREAILNSHYKNITSTLPVVSMSDFYSTSEFIDLLMHVQALDFSIDELEKLYRKNYHFLGFMFANIYEKNNYAKKFPQDKEMTNLENWKKLEKDNNKLFSSMYQFWLQKK